MHSVINRSFSVFTWYSLLAICIDFSRLKKSLKVYRDKSIYTWTESKCDSSCLHEPVMDTTTVKGSVNCRFLIGAKYISEPFPDPTLNCAVSALYKLLTRPNPNICRTISFYYSLRLKIIAKSGYQITLCRYEYEIYSQVTDLLICRQAQVNKLGRNKILLSLFTKLTFK